MAHTAPFKVIKNEAKNKVVILHVDISSFITYKHVQFPNGMKIVDVDETTDVGKQLMQKLNLRKDCEWVVTKHDKKSVENKKLKSILWDIRQSLRKNKQYTLHIQHLRTKGITTQSPLCRAAHALVHSVVAERSMGIDLVQLILSFADTKQELHQHAWHIIADIKDDKYKTEFKAVHPVITACSTIDMSLVRNIYGDKYAQNEELLLMAVQNKAKIELLSLDAEANERNDMYQVYDAVVKKQNREWKFTLESIQQKQLKCTYRKEQLWHGYGFVDLVLFVGLKHHSFYVKAMERPIVIDMRGH